MKWNKASPVINHTKTKMFLPSRFLQDVLASVFAMRKPKTTDQHPKTPACDGRCLRGPLADWTGRRRRAEPLGWCVPWRCCTATGRCPQTSAAPARAKYTSQV